MKKISFILALFLALTLTFTGCSDSNTDRSQSGNSSQGSENYNSQNQDSRPNSETGGDTNSSENSNRTTELEVCFGDDGAPFILHLYDNDTAAAIARHVGTANWRLPIYHYDDYDNWEVMQYYDVPSRYEIPSNPETVTSEKAGEVYYSAPNRIVLFFGDAEVTGEYTKVGYFAYTEEFRAAVENNPVLEGWDTKRALINRVD